MDAELRATMRTEIVEMVQGLDTRAAQHVGGPAEDEDVMSAVIDRRMRHTGAALIRILDSHPLTPAGRCTTCSRWETCPTQALLESWAEGWLGTGGLASRTEGDPRRVSSRRLA